MNKKLDGNVILDIVLILRYGPTRQTLMSDKETAAMLSLYPTDQRFIYHTNAIDACGTP